MIVPAFVDGRLDMGFVNMVGRLPVLRLASAIVCQRVDHWNSQMGRWNIQQSNRRKIHTAAVRSFVPMTAPEFVVGPPARAFAKMVERRQGLRLALANV
jgi:hypothetical protein